MQNQIDLANQRFGRLLVTSFDSVVNRKKHWNCTCECGKTTIVPTAKLRNGHTQSCGCIRQEKASKSFKTHGATGTLTYRRWKSMLSRCNTVNSKSYPRYGGRGITVCDRWVTSFDNFLADMGECPGDEFTLDRRENDGNYELKNCKWATRKEQNRNTSRTRSIEFNGQIKSLSEWCEIYCVPYNRVHNRLKRGQSFIEAFEVKEAA